MLAGLAAGSGYSQDELPAGLSMTYPVDVVGVTNCLCADKAVQILLNSIGQNNYSLCANAQYSLQPVSSAIILDSVDGQLSGFGIMSRIPVSQRL